MPLMGAAVSLTRAGAGGPFPVGPTNAIDRRRGRRPCAPDDGGATRSGQQGKCGQHHGSPAAPSRRQRIPWSRPGGTGRIADKGGGILATEPREEGDRGLANAALESQHRRLRRSRRAGRRSAVKTAPSNRHRSAARAGGSHLVGEPGHRRGFDGLHHGAGDGLRCRGTSRGRSHRPGGPPGRAASRCRRGRDECWSTRSSGSSARSESAAARSANLLAEYAASPGETLMPAPELMNTTCPRGPQRRQQRATA